MRSTFRYPVTSISLMVLSLVLVIIAIEKALAIQRSLPLSNPSLVVEPVHYALPQSLAVMFAVTYVAAVCIWAILFAVRRAGVHRLSDAETWSKTR